MRRTLVAALLLLACDQDVAREPYTPADVIDASALDATKPTSDATCATSTGLQDFDDDGFSRQQGDCDDCDPKRGPASYDYPANGIDEDCKDGDAVMADAPCDDDLEEGELDPEKALRAIGMCTSHGPNARYWGLLDARFERLDRSKTGLGDDRQLWLPTKFGDILPREGTRLMAVSTGVARDVKSDDYTEQCDVFGGTPDAGSSWPGGSTPPKGFPRDSKACGREPISSDALAYDDVVLHVRMRAPTNASTLAFDSLFLTYEYPDFVCSAFNDFFVVLMDPAPREADADDNILFDADGDAVGVNSALLSVCRRDAGRVGRSVVCEHGPELLKNTGYDRFESTCAPVPPGESNIGGASTGWLHTEMPVRPGRTFELRFILWDSGDPWLDSTVLLDNFRFLSTPPKTGTVGFTAN